MNFLRIIKEKENRIKSMPEALTSYNFLKQNIANFHADLFHGFETKKNTLSLFEFQSESDIERIIANSEVNRTRLNNLPKEIHYVELSSNYLQSIGLTFINSPLKNNYYDSLCSKNHYDIIDLDNLSLSNLIFKLNDDILKGVVKKKSLTKNEIFYAISKNYKNGNLKLEDYFDLEQIKDFLKKIPAH